MSFIERSIPNGDRDDAPIIDRTALTHNARDLLAIFEAIAPVARRIAAAEYDPNRRLAITIANRLARATLRDVKSLLNRRI